MELLWLEALRPHKLLVCRAPSFRRFRVVQHQRRPAVVVVHDKFVERIVVLVAQIAVVATAGSNSAGFSSRRRSHSRRLVIGRIPSSIMPSPFPGRRDVAYRRRRAAAAAVAEIFRLAGGEFRRQFALSEQAAIADGSGRRRESRGGGRQFGILGGPRAGVDEVEKKLFLLELLDLPLHFVVEFLLDQSDHIVSVGVGSNYVVLVLLFHHFHLVLFPEAQPEKLVVPLFFKRRPFHSEVGIGALLEGG